MVRTTGAKRRHSSPRFSPEGRKTTTWARIKTGKAAAVSFVSKLINVSTPQNASHHICLFSRHFRYARKLPKNKILTGASTVDPDIHATPSTWRGWRA